MTAARLPAAARDLFRGPPAGPDAELLARFAAARDEAAFAELVRRHGPAVWDVCRAVAGNPADADDAFQAVFLLLARRAAGLRKPGSLGAWLHGVAVRVARKARAAAARRAARERTAARGEAAPAEPSWSDVRAAVHAALAVLPAAYRDPLVACYLRGLSHAAAAAELGLSPAALKKRLERGRDRLRAVLARRGFGPAVLLAVGAVPAAAVPAPLLAAARRLAAGGAVPAGVRHLTTGGLSMSFLKVSAAAGLLAAVGFAVAGGPPDPRAANEPPRPGGGPPPAPELVGAWKVKAVEVNGQPLLTAEGLKNARVVFEAGHAELTGFQFGVVGNFAFKLDPAKQPKEIDVIPADGPLRGKTLAGVYVSRPDEVRVCVRVEQPDRGRPKGFVTNGGAGLVTMILEPVAPPKAADDPRSKGMNARLVVRPASGRPHERAAYLELFNDAATPAHVDCDLATLRPKLDDPDGRTLVGIDERPVRLLGGGPHWPRSAVVPPGGYAGFATVLGLGLEYIGREEGTLVRFGGHMWKLPAGRYTLSGRVELRTRGPDKTDPTAATVDLVPTPFILP